MSSSVVSPTRPKMVQPMPWVMPTSSPWARKVPARASMSSFFVPGFMMITIVIFSFSRHGRKRKKAPIDDKINERANRRYNGPNTGQPIHFIPLFSHAKKAGAHKSSPAKIGKETGCSCEAAHVHENIPHLEWLGYFTPDGGKMQE